jgi:hypothetical protein
MANVRTTKAKDPKIKGRKNPLLIWNVPPKVRQQFRIACLRKGVSMQDAIIQFMTGYGKNA